MIEREVDIERALDAFASADEQASLSGFTSLRKLCSQDAERTAGILQGDERADAVQQAWINIWEARRSFRPSGCHRWLRFLKLTVARCCFDIVKKRPPTSDEVDPEAIRAVVFEVIDELLPDLEKIMGEVWCGYPSEVSTRDRSRRVLAVKMLLIDHATPADIRRKLFRGVPPPEADSSIEEWAQADAVLRDLAFRALFFDRGRLTAHLLGIPQKDVITTLNRAMTNPNDAPPPGDWSWSEVGPIIHRYFCGHPESDVEVTFGIKFRELDDRCRARLPFLPVMRLLRRVFDNRNDLTNIRLWKRLCFQYWYGEEIRQKEIFDRLEKPAALGGYALTTGTLNVWFGNRRLLLELLRYVKRTETDDE